MIYLILYAVNLRLDELSKICMTPVRVTPFLVFEQPLHRQNGDC